MWFSLNERNEQISVHLFRLLFLFVKIDFAEQKFPFEDVNLTSLCGSTKLDALWLNAWGIIGIGIT